MCFISAEDGQLAVGVVFTRKDRITEERKGELPGLYAELRSKVGHLLDLQFYSILDAQCTQDDGTKQFLHYFNQFCAGILKVSLATSKYFDLFDGRCKCCE